ncbi:hypothetical protein G6F63_015600 [Rhizopus arrhizus]|nr:hypothetical protein G6F63_015600 [Rhizopus arrhizus]
MRASCPAVALASRWIAAKAPWYSPCMRRSRSPLASAESICRTSSTVLPSVSSSWLMPPVRPSRKLAPSPACRRWSRSPAAAAATMPATAFSSDSSCVRSCHSTAKPRRTPCASNTGVTTWAKCTGPICTLPL